MPETKGRVKETKMKSETRLLWLLSVVVLLFSPFGLPVTDDTGFRVDPAACNGSIAECQAEQEFLLDSETNRRFLQQKVVLTKNALLPGPACDVGGGQSYGGHCLPLPSNRLTRGCNPYDHCRINGK